MDQLIIDDLKQFIDASIGQSTVEIRSDVAALRTDMSGFISEARENFAHVNLRLNELELKVETIADAHAEQLIDYGDRISRLES